MASGSDDRVRLIFELQTEQLKQGKASFDELMVSIENLKADFDAGTVSQTEYADQFMKLATEAGKANKEIEKLEAETARASRTMAASTDGIAKTSAGLEKISTHSKSSGQGLQKMAFFLDDMQYVGEQGLRPILNNLMMIDPKLFFVALALDQVIRHWGELSATTKTYADTLDGLKEKLQDLEKNPIKLSVDMHNIDEARHKIDELTKARQELKSLQSTLTPEQSSVSKSLDEAITSEDHGGDKLATALKNSLRSGDKAFEKQPLAANFNQRIADINKRRETNPFNTTSWEEVKAKTAVFMKYGSFSLDKARDELILQIRAEEAGAKIQYEEAAVAEMIHEAKTTPEGLKRLQGLVESRPDDFRKQGLSDNFLAGVVTAGQQGPENARHVKRQEEAAKEAKKAAAEKERKRQADLSEAIAYEAENTAHFNKAEAARNHAKVEAKVAANKAKADAKHAAALAKQAANQHEQEVNRQVGALGAGVINRAEAALAQGLDPQSAANLFARQQHVSGEVAAKAIEKAQLDLAKRQNNLQMQGIEGNFATMQIVRSLNLELANMGGLLNRIRQDQNEVRRQMMRRGNARNK